MDGSTYIKSASQFLIPRTHFQYLGSSKPLPQKHFVALSSETMLFDHSADADTF